MSRLSQLLQKARSQDPHLAEEIEREIRHLEQRRAFGLNFERHTPESVELPGRKIRRGDKVRVLPPRGENPTKENDLLWTVAALDRNAGAAHLQPLDHDADATRAPLEDLVVTAEFTDPIYPGLVSTGKVERGGDKPFHTVINAENYHALETLLFTHQGKIDAIYIDPPYNTGAKDWKYNNDYVDNDDVYRHSKWLAFMERRLKLAKELLNPDDSVLIVTIDEKEYLRLGLLLSQVFPSARLQMVSSLINPAGTGRANELSRTDEYIFFVRLGEHQLIPELVEDSKDIEVSWPTFRRAETSSARPNRPAQFYPIHIDIAARKILDVGSPLAPGVDRKSVPTPEGCVAVFPVRDDGTEMNWGLTRSSLLDRLNKGYVRIGNYTPERPQPFVIKYLKSGPIRDIESGKVSVRGYREDGSVVAYYGEGKTKMPTTQWNKPSHDAYRHGTTLLKRVFNEQRFPFPKSLYAVEDCLRLAVGDKPSAVVLDFFAGSGTTAHAVMRLNKQDDGCRQSISVTNNEVSADEQNELRATGHRPGDPQWEALGICDFITKPRITAAITGITHNGDLIKGDYKFADEFPMADGFKENAEFFTLTYEAPSRVSRNRDFLRIAPLLWLAAGAQGRRIENATAGWDVAETYGVLANLDQTQEFVDAMQSAGTTRYAFVVTDDERSYQRIAGALPHRVESVRLYEQYLKNFEILVARSAR